ncbi:hypothetical protein LAZ67_7002439 [Cordylochernes scorpioides]|uniref:Uncharacterized protein n=1 Tax=Cordylochernes scorpioides TaxID=51811 RepID=A0ABY6KNM9_9ARAC|nr:hypothetical protein LAZ67_7002439 [Cordylochernes scorpioides]
MVNKSGKMDVSTRYSACSKSFNRYIQIEEISNSRPLLPLDSNFDSYEALIYFLNGSPLLAIPDLSHISKWNVFNQ